MQAMFFFLARRKNVAEHHSCALQQDHTYDVGHQAYLAYFTQPDFSVALERSVQIVIGISYIMVPNLSPQGRKSCVAITQIKNQTCLVIQMVSFCFVTLFPLWCPSSNNVVAKVQWLQRNVSQCVQLRTEEDFSIWIQKSPKRSIDRRLVFTCFLSSAWGSNRLFCVSIATTHMVFAICADMCPKKWVCTWLLTCVGGGKKTSKK